MRWWSCILIISQKSYITKERGRLDKLAFATSMSYKESVTPLQHMFSVETSDNKHERGSESTLRTHGKNDIEEGENRTSQHVKVKDTKAELLKSYKSDIYFAVVLLISAGSLAGLLWHITKTDNAVDKLGTKVDFLEKKLVADSSKIVGTDIKQTTMAQHSKMKSMSSPSTSSAAGAATFHSPSTVAVTGMIQTTMAYHSTMTTKESQSASSTTTATFYSTVGIGMAQTTTAQHTKVATTTPPSTSSASARITFRSPTTAARTGMKRTTAAQSSKMMTTPSPSGTSAIATATFPSLTKVEAAPNRFRVLQAKETENRNYSFLAVQVEVPTDGLSVSDNWCRDYENLCKQFVRRPTGCESKFNSSSFTSCSTLYSAYMHEGDLLGCSPSDTISAIANNIFSGLSPPAMGNNNSFGFYMCDGTRCGKTIRQSEYSVHGMSAFWNFNITKMYTVCH